jgi:tetratricopeptide (TPR) repeat protein
MGKSTATILLITLLSLSVKSQNQTNNYKYQTAKVVYDALVNAFGDGRTSPELKFIMSKDMKDSAVAAYVPGDFPVIEFEELAYDVCSSFGKDSLNALACVLGHELSHYYLKHDWCSSFSKRLSRISIAADLNKIDRQDQLKNETQADYTGFYFGNVAGYRTFDIAPELLKKLYTAYKLNPNLKGYPTLDQRIEAAKQSKIMVLRRLPVFEAGTYLYTIGEYEMAFDCFNNLLSDFTSRENYNNAAVSKMQLALPLYEIYEMPYCFPFELDYESRINAGNNRSGTAANNEEKRSGYLSDAKILLEESIRKDPHYNQAKINLAICYIMLGNPDMSSGILKDMGTDTSSDKKLLASICLAVKGNFAKGLQELNSITSSTNSAILENNKALFRIASDKSLKIGDDELGYQLRIMPHHLSKNSEPKENTYYLCFDSTSKSINLKRDSIRIASDDMLYLLKGDKNYDIGMLIQKPSLGYSIFLYVIADKNPCNEIKSHYILFHSDNKKLHFETGSLIKSAYAKKE